jgi:dTDP-glucose 4,6-dehydratase
MSHEARALVLGGAGFVGSHLCEALLAAGTEVVCVDNFCTGRPGNLSHLDGRADFSIVEHDVTRPLPELGRFRWIFALASAASPVDYQRLPIETLRAGAQGTEHALQLAREHGARFVLASTSEVYGDPDVHPQAEDYPGRVNPVGPRSVYDEAKRFAEALTAAYRRSCGVDTGIARIFNTYGPRMRPDDGRMVPTFIRQALAGEPLTVTGSGRQTRSLCYITDTVAGLIALARSDAAGPVNIGNPHEQTVLEVAEQIAELAGGSPAVTFCPPVEDDPQQRCPDIALAQKRLGWFPAVPVREGLQLTIDWFRTAYDGHRRLDQLIANHL